MASSILLLSLLSFANDLQAEGGCLKLVPEWFRNIAKLMYVEASQHAVFELPEPVSRQIKVLEQGEVSSQDYRQLARLYEESGMLQEAIWTYRKSGERAEAQRLSTQLRMILTQAPINSSRVLGGGVSKTLLIELPSRIAAVYKPKQDSFAANHFYEVAAYEVDALFGFDLVPMTVLRDSNGVQGSAQYFIKGAIAGHSKTDELMLLDYILANNDRQDRNFLVGPDGKVIAIDHGLAFDWAAYGFSFENLRIKKNVYAALRGSTCEVVYDRLEHLISSAYKAGFTNNLTPDYILESLCQRLQVVVKKLENQIQRNGEDVVLH